MARRTAAGAARSGLLWGYVAGAFVAASAWSYTSIYKTRAERDALAAAFGSNHATIALFGPAPDLQTVGGFTVFKVSMTIMIIGAVWGLLTATRLLRGEEEAGRWDLLLTGGVSARRACAQGLLGLGAGAGVFWAVTAVITAVVGLWARVDIKAGPGSFLALALVANAVMFGAVGALTSQLAPTRRQAAGYAAVVLAVSYALRMVGDAGVGLHWLIWVSPMGWVERLAPLTAPDPAPLVPIAAFSAVMAGASVYLAGRRDVGSSLLPDRTNARAHLALLGSPLGLTARLGRGVAVGWTVALALGGLLFGVVARSVGSAFSGSSVRQVLDRLGATGGGAGAYLGVAFLIVAVAVGFAAAGQIGATRAEESEGRLDHLLVGPVSRARWLAGRLVIAVALVVSGGVVAGVFTWFAMASLRPGFDAWTLVAAGVNATVPALFVLGIGALLFGLWPRAAALGVYVVLGWSLLIELVGGIGALSHWLLDTSVFHYVAAAPSVPVDWTSDAVLVALGVLGALGGFVGFSRQRRAGCLGPSPRCALLAGRAHDPAVLEEVDQHVAAQHVGGGVEGAPAVDPGDLLHEGVVRALEVQGERVDGDTRSGAADDLGHGAAQRLGDGRIVEPDLAVVVDVRRRLAVGDHDDLLGAVLVGQHASRQGQHVLEVGAVDVVPHGRGGSRRAGSRAPPRRSPRCRG